MIKPILIQSFRHLGQINRRHRLSGLLTKIMTGHAVQAAIARHLVPGISHLLGIAERRVGKLRQLVVLVRHARNIALFKRLKVSEGVDGRIRYSQWLTLEMSCMELCFMALLLFAAALVSGTAMLYGGTLAVLVTGLEHRKLSRRQRLQDQDAGTAGQAAEDR